MRRSARSLIRIAGIIALVFTFTMSDTLMQTILPISLTETGAASVAMIGVLIAIPQGVGFLTAMPGAAAGDARGRGRVVAVCACIGAIATVTISITSVGHSWLWWIVPLLLFGLTRLTVWVSILATISTTGDRLRMQGINGATQRLAAALGALVAATVIARHAWEWGYALIGTGFFALAALALVVMVRPADDAGVSVPTRASYGLAVQLAGRDRAIKAASMAAMSCLTLILVGNSFFALTMDVGAGELAALVALLLVTRDVASVLIGLTFKRLVDTVGLSGTVTIAMACGVTSMGVLAVAGGTPPGIVCAAILQGTGICLLIGSSNLLAVASSGMRTGGPGLRMAASQIGPGIAALLLPVALASALEFGGAGLLYGLAGSCLLVLGLVALSQMRPLRALHTFTVDSVDPKGPEHHDREPHDQAPGCAAAADGNSASRQRTDPVADLPPSHPGQRDLGPASRPQ